MDPKLHTWQFIAAALANRVPVMLLYVVESRGSSPGRAGFFMAVDGEGRLQGSIGGGIMEYKLVEMARERLRQHITEPLLSRQIHDKSALHHQSGMICSGEQTVFIYPLPGETAPVVHQIIQSIGEGTERVLHLSQHGLALSTSPDAPSGFTAADDQTWHYCEKLGLLHRLHIIGAGHCALALSQVMRLAGFYISLYDDRPALNTFEDNPYAHKKILLPGYEAIALQDLSADDYIVVMTVGYRTDDLVLRTLMNKRFRFLGVLGSRKKLEKMFVEYRKEGVAEPVLDRIHAPVGLPVNSRTPEEIAISIAAQLIAVKNKAVL